MRIFNAAAWLAGTVLCLTFGITMAQTNASQTAADSAEHAKNIRFQDLKWERMQPELGDKASEIHTPDDSLPEKLPRSQALAYGE